MKSYSQAAQDLFVHEILPKNDGNFLEIGCCHPSELSNTYALEQLGWRGLMVDNDANAVAICRLHRKSIVIFGDATALDWSRLLYEREIDYLSLDVDGATRDVLKALPLKQVQFNVATIETDKYRFGDGPRDAMRAIMAMAGYDLICADVCSSDGLPYEDWWVSPAFSKAAERFRCSNQKWSDILNR